MNSQTQSNHQLFRQAGSSDGRTMLGFRTAHCIAYLQLLLERVVLEAVVVHDGIRSNRGLVQTRRLRLVLRQQPGGQRVGPIGRFERINVGRAQSVVGYGGRGGMRCCGWN